MNLKKPKFWDYKKPNLYAYLLYPIAFFIQTTKKLFPKLNKKKFKIKTVCIGAVLPDGPCDRCAHREAR